MTNRFKVIHFPQLQSKPFEVEAGSIEEAVKIRDVLGFYDLFQFENRIKPDYANMTIIEKFDFDDNEWFSLDEFDIEELLDEKE